MNATALPAVSPSPISTTRQRAAEIIRAWLEWRASRAARPRLDVVVDGAMLVALIGTWTLGYCCLCPAELVRHPQAQRVATLRH